MSLWKWVGSALVAASLVGAVAEGQESPLYAANPDFVPLSEPAMVAPSAGEQILLANSTIPNPTSPSAAPNYYLNAYFAILSGGSVVADEYLPPTEQGWTPIGDPAISSGDGTIQMAYDAVLNQVLLDPNALADGGVSHSLGIGVTPDYGGIGLLPPYGAATFEPDGGDNFDMPSSSNAIVSYVSFTHYPSNGEPEVLVAQNLLLWPGPPSPGEFATLLVDPDDGIGAEVAYIDDRSSATMDLYLASYLADVQCLGSYCSYAPVNWTRQLVASFNPPGVDGIFCPGGIRAVDVNGATVGSIPDLMRVIPRPSMASDPAGRIYIAWAEIDGVYLTVCERPSPPNLAVAPTCQGAIPVDTSTGIARFQPAITANGNGVYVTYDVIEAGGLSTYLAIGDVEKNGSLAFHKHELRELTQASVPPIDQTTCYYGDYIANAVEPFSFATVDSAWTQPWNFGGFTQDLSVVLASYAAAHF
ncbi:MAG: hypothetical protein ACYCWW_12955 [Deltaproteobacteria bacterium]